VSASSTTTRPLHVCAECGAMNPAAEDAIRGRDEQIAILIEDVGNLERELRVKRAKIRQQKAEQDDRLRNSDVYADAMEVLERWRRDVYPAARELGGKRLENAIARLKGGYSKSELIRCVSGYALKPYIVNGVRSHAGTRDQWHADAELLLRDARHVDAGIRIADHADELRNVLGPKAAPEPETKVTLSELGQAAVRFASFGWAVFPVVAGDKMPATANGLLDAKRDVDVITNTWARHPRLNVGIRCGAESGIVVLDVDGEEGWDSLHRLEDMHGELPQTASVTTPSGGQHFYFQHPGFEVRNTAGWPAVGLDLRGDGGYVLAPGSIHPNGGTYEPDEQAAVAPMPEWLADAIRTREQKAALEIGEGRDWGAFISEGSDAGERDNRMTSYVGHMFSRGHDAGEVLEHARVLNAAKVRPPLGERDLQRIVKSIAKRRVA
jgi:hypothetical protein